MLSFIIYTTWLFTPKIRNLPPLSLLLSFAKTSTIVKLKFDISMPIALSGSIPKMYAKAPRIVPKCAIKIKSNKTPLKRTIPPLGKNSEEILGKLGYRRIDVKKLKKRKITN